MNNNFTILIPARINSIRFPKKVLADINGLPMIIRVAREALKTKADNVYIATDSEEIANTCKKYNIKFVLTSSHHKSGTERIVEAIKKIKTQRIIINVQGDEPLINPEHINLLAENMINSDFVMGTIATPINNIIEFNNPNLVKVIIDKNAQALYFSRSNIPFFRNDDNLNNALKHIGIYAYKKDFLLNYDKLEISNIENIESLEQLRVLWNGYKIKVCIIDNIDSIGVDTIEDLELVKDILNKNKDIKL